MTLTFVILALALVVSLIYLAHANRTATRGYALKKLEIEKNQLQTQAEIWEQKVSEAESLNTITASPTVKGMQPVKFLHLTTWKGYQPSATGERPFQALPL